MKKLITIILAALYAESSKVLTSTFLQTFLYANTIKEPPRAEKVSARGGSFCYTFLLPFLELKHECCARLKLCGGCEADGALRAYIGS